MLCFPFLISSFPFIYLFFYIIIMLKYFRSSKYKMYFFLNCKKLTKPTWLIVKK